MAPQKGNADSPSRRRDIAQLDATRGNHCAVKLVGQRRGSREIPEREERGEGFLERAAQGQIQELTGDPTPVNLVGYGVSWPQPKPGALRAGTYGLTRSSGEGCCDRPNALPSATLPKSNAGQLNVERSRFACSRRAMGPQSRYSGDCTRRQRMDTGPLRALVHPRFCWWK